MRIVGRLFMLVLAVALLAPVVGCASVGASVADNRRAFNRVVNFDARMLVDDISLLVQTNRPLRTSRWMID